ncbi:hypothetical protein CVS40_6534 [Lucilia cuprina]|nr:hypothetical protein CVS40_6534 [Lucilia cuprina]
MSVTNPFLCDIIDKSLMRVEWEKWFRPFKLYLASEEIDDPIKKKNKLLHLGGPQLQEVIFNIPGALVEHDPNSDVDVFAILVTKNSTFERHLYRTLVPSDAKSEIEDICIKDKIIDPWAPIELRKKLLERGQSLDDVIEASCWQGPMKSVLDVVEVVTLAALGIDILLSNERQRFPRGDMRRVMKSTERECSDEENELRQLDCFKINNNNEGDEIIECHIGGEVMQMFIDSGSRFNFVSEKDWAILKNRKSIVWNIRSNFSNQFKAYASDQILRVLCVFHAPISVNNNSEKVATSYVIENGTQSLLGRETSIVLKVLRLGLNVNRIENVKPFPKMKNIQVKLFSDTSVKPVQQPLRRIPIALEDKVSAKLDEAISLDIIEPVHGPSPWISPVVIVFKGNGEMMLCIDMRRSNLPTFESFMTKLRDAKYFSKFDLKSNGEMMLCIGMRRSYKAIMRENYPLPTFESFMTKLRDAKYFSKLDLKSAYHQLELHESSSNCLNYIDDVIIFGSTKEEHDKAVKEVIDVFKENNLAVNNEKCVWNTQKLKFLEHILSDKVITEFRAPNTKEEIRSLEFELVTDHKPLESIFNPTSKPPARIERWLLRLQSFKFKVIYRSGKENIADSVSRLCKISETNSFDGNCENNIFLIVTNSIPIPITITLIAKRSAENEEICNNIKLIKDKSWDLNNQAVGTRIVIPKSLRNGVLELAHEGHPGESAMKRRLKAKVWRPLIDKEAESFVKSCRDCLLVSQLTNPVPMQRHAFPNGPWQCVATDLLGPLPNNEYHIKTPPYWPQANDEVENINKSLVKRLKIAIPPSELMFNRVIRDKIPSIHDRTEDMIDSSARDLDCIKKQQGKERGDRTRKAKESDITLGDKVLLKNVIFPHKLTTNFDVTEYEVVERNGNEVCISHVQKFHHPLFSSTPINTLAPTLTDDTSEGSTQQGDHMMKLKLQKYEGCGNSNQF